MRFLLWMLMMSRSCSHSRHTLDTSLKCHQITRNEEWIIVFCRHTIVTELWVAAGGDWLHVHITASWWQLILNSSSLLSVAQVSLKRCLLRSLMTGWHWWWHGAGHWSAAQVAGVQRDSDIQCREHFRYMQPVWQVYSDHPSQRNSVQTRPTKLLYCRDPEIHV